MQWQFWGFAGALRHSIIFRVEVLRQDGTRSASEQTNLHILCRCGSSSCSVRPRCFWGTRPSAATLMRTASTPDAIMLLSRAA